VAEGSDIPERDGRGAVTKAGHVPVLLKEAIDFLDIKRDGSYIDATVGLGGHSYEIAKRLGAQGHLIGLDKDPAALEATRAKLSSETEDFPRLTLLHASFAEIGKRFDPASADGLLADVGMSSLQLNDAARGFSFQAEGPLDMRMNPQAELTADQVVNQVDEVTLANLIYEFGDERRSNYCATRRDRIGRGPANEPGGKTNSSRDENLSSTPNLRKRRTERPAGAHDSRSAGAETWRQVSDHQLSLAGRPHRQRCSPRRSKAGSLSVTDEKARNARRRRDSTESAIAKCEIAGSRASLNILKL
jgi:hypothetical protein